MDTLHLCNVVRKIIQYYNKTTLLNGGTVLESQFPILNKSQLPPLIKYELFFITISSET